MTAPLQGTSYYFWVLGCVDCLLLFLPGSQASVLAQLPHLSSPTWAGQVPVFWWEAVPRGAPGAVGKGPKVVGKGSGRSLGSPQPLQLRQDGLGMPPARLWQMPGIARVFLAPSLVSEGTRNISCPGRHGG